MPLLWSCFEFLKPHEVNSIAKNVLDVGFLQIFKITQAPPLQDPAEPLEEPPTNPRSLSHEVLDDDGWRTYPGDQPLGMVGPYDKDFKGLKAGQCMCCCYRQREILERTSGGPRVVHSRLVLG